MPAYKEKNNSRWYVVTRYTDWQGVRKSKLKRGFATKREALEWERRFQLQSTSNMDMTFEAFVELYGKVWKKTKRKIRRELLNPKYIKGQKGRR